MNKIQKDYEKIIKNLTKELEKDVKVFLELALIDRIENELTLYSLEARQNVLKQVTTSIENLKDIVGYSKYRELENLDILISDLVNEKYITTCNNVSKFKKLEEKEKLENLENDIYKELNESIITSLSNKRCTIDIVKTQFKNGSVFEAVQKDYNNINSETLKKAYIRVKKRIIQDIECGVYKNQIEEQTIRIPFFWKTYIITKAINKLLK